MAINYARLAAVATKLLQPAPVGAGMALALRRVTPGTYNPAAGTATGDTTTDLPTVGAWVAQSADYQVTGRGVGGVVRVSDVLSQDRTMVIDGSVAPQLEDKLMVAGAPWQVLAITIIQPALTPIAYRCVVRQ
jgi:hypothetical protein